MFFKKTFFIKIILSVTSLFIAVFIIWPKATFAQKATPTATPSAKTQNQQESDIEKVQKIKEMVASRVAELKLVEKKGILGNVLESSNSQINLQDATGAKRIVDIDELTKFQGSEKSFGISDIKQGEILLAVGLYNKDTKRLLARFVIQKKSLPIQLEGIIIAKDSKEFQLTMLDEKSNKKIIDIETLTKIQSYTASTGQGKSGFSKIQEEQRALVTGFYDLKDNSKIIANRLIHFPDLPISDALRKVFENYASQKTSSPSSEKTTTPKQ